MNKKKQNLITQNQKLIYHVLNRMFIFAYHTKYEDFVSAGKLGLVKAVLTYDPKKGSFSNHAFFYIRKEIQICMAEISDPAICYKIGPNAYKTQKEKRTVGLNFETDEHIFIYHLSPDENLRQNERLELIRDFIKEMGDPEFLYWVFNTQTNHYYTREEKIEITKLIKKYHPLLSHGKARAKSYLFHKYKLKAKKLLKHHSEYKEIFS